MSAHAKCNLCWRYPPVRFPSSTLLYSNARIVITRTMAQGARGVRLHNSVFTYILYSFLLRAFERSCSQ
jgi:hypothetical protein